MPLWIDVTVMWLQLKSIAVQAHYISALHQKKAPAGSRKMEAHSRHLGAASKTDNWTVVHQQQEMQYMMLLD